jgi:hypothetical protein
LEAAAGVEHAPSVYKDFKKAGKLARFTLACLEPSGAYEPYALVAGIAQGDIQPNPFFAKEIK